ncbi:hypothetical protein AMECASPLE_003600 [Ameca splendens]|uniref:Uncharacterized protein n=1 Tax=Ameca splendens TaxID=208324 RepID=A0ABV0Y9N3_9TELE
MTRASKNLPLHGAASSKYRVAGELVAISSGLRARGGVHPGQIASPSQGNIEIQRTNNPAHKSMPKGSLKRPANLTVHVFGLWEEAEVPGENPCMHGENM